jgi:hypothetical protein
MEYYIIQKLNKEINIIGNTIIFIITINVI